MFRTLGPILARMSVFRHDPNRVSPPGVGPAKRLVPGAQSC